MIISQTTEMNKTLKQTSNNIASCYYAYIYASKK